jgi:hypothetical protein
MRGPILAAALLAALSLGVRVLAEASGQPPQPAVPPTDESMDLQLIPPSAQQPSSAAPPSVPRRPRRIYLESAVTLSSQRDELLVPAPPPPPYDWQGRLFLDWREEWSLGGGVRLNFSDRLNLRFENDIDFPSQENLINELRELYVSAEPAPRSYFDLGRINLKSGVALGYNPTDYFKTRAVVEPLSLDPSVLRENRLGTVMVRAQHIWERGSMTAAFAPALSEPAPIYTHLNLPSLNPMFGVTNAQSRFLLKGSVDLASNLSPEFLLYRGGSETQVGFNLAENVSQRMVAYLEWSGGRQPTLVGQAVKFGRETGTLPSGVRSVLPEDSQQSFMNQLALGISYTTQTRVTVNLEYHYNQSGFTAVDWNRWFSVGQAGLSNPAIAAELWYVRDYALDQQQPVTQHSLFLRADWVDAFVPKLELVGLVDSDLHDGSSVVQLSADYYVSDTWTVGALVAAFVGPRRSDFGSLPQARSVLLKVVRYF